MSEMRLAMAERQIEELKSQINLQSGTISQMLDMIRVALEEDDDPDEALRMVKEFIGDDAGPSDEPRECLDDEIGF